MEYQTLRKLLTGRRLYLLNKINDYKSRLLEDYDQDLANITDTLEDELNFVNDAIKLCQYRGRF